MKYENSKLAKFKKQYRTYANASNSRLNHQPVRDNVKLNPLDKHAHHQVEIREVRGTQHYGKYWCLQCNMFISWISKKEWIQAKALGL